MLAHQRQQQILKLVETHRQLSVQELLDELPISSATARRDLAALERRGKVVRVHGGVIHPDSAFGEIPFVQRLESAAAEKRAIAHEAAALVPHRASVFIDSGSTFIELAKILLQRKDLTLYTNSIPVLNHARRAEATVISIGGEVKPVSEALVGSLALDWLRHLRFDLAFIGCTGISRSEGPSSTAINEAVVKQQAMSRSRRSILLADSTKWEKPSSVTLAPWSVFESWITDDGILNASGRTPRIRDIKVVVARCGGSR